MHRGYTTPLVIAIMAFAIVAFLFLIDTAIMPANSNKTTNRTANKNADDVACTMEAKLCPDGSAVGRSGPNCEFAECPTTTNTNSATNQNTNTATDPTAGWKTYSSKQYGLTFKYPNNWEVEEGTLNSPYSVFAHPDNSSNMPSLRFWLDKAYDGLSTPSGTKTTTSSVTYAGRSAALSKTITSTNELLIAHVQFTTTPSGWGSDSTISLSPDNAGSIEIPLQIMETLTITDPTAGWKTYTSTTYGYSVKHPVDWKTSTCSDSETIWFGTQGVLCASDANTWDFSISRQSASFILEETLQQTKNLIVDPVQTTLFIDGIPATRLSGQTKDNIGPGSNQYIETIYFPHGNRYYTIHYAADGLIGEEYKDNFKLFTQSFTFTD